MNSVELLCDVEIFVSLSVIIIGCGLLIYVSFDIPQCKRPEMVQMNEVSL